MEVGKAWFSGPGSAVGETGGRGEIGPSVGRNWKRRVRSTHVDARALRQVGPARGRCRRRFRAGGLAGSVFRLAKRRACCCLRRCREQRRQAPPRSWNAPRSPERRQHRRRLRSACDEKPSTRCVECVVGMRICHTQANFVRGTALPASAKRRNVPAALRPPSSCATLSAAERGGGHAGSQQRRNFAGPSSPRALALRRQTAPMRRRG